MIVVGASVLTNVVAFADERGHKTRAVLTREAVTTQHDAAYVALAEARGALLVTADARLAGTASAYCRVELVG